VTVDARHFTFEPRQGRGVYDCIELDAIDPKTGKVESKIEITVSPRARNVSIWVDGEPYYVALDRGGV